MVDADRANQARIAGRGARSAQPARLSTAVPAVASTTA
jgi:hypothetical protein